jgi:ankyrin repeat protein
LQIKFNLIDGQTQLHVAATNGDLPKAMSLLQDGIAINLQDKNGWTALHCAAYSRNKQIFALLLAQESVDVSVKNESGSTALHYFARNFDAAHYDEDQVLESKESTDFVGRPIGFSYSQKC